MRRCLLFLVMGLTVVVAGAAANPARDAILVDLAGQAKADDAAFTGFSAARGGAFFTATQTSGKPATPSCTTCHSSSPTQSGKTRAGKAIAPMAVSATPERYTDAAKVAKWFRRNCKSVVGRECTAMEKGDFLTFMISQ